MIANKQTQVSKDVANKKIVVVRELMPRWLKCGKPGLKRNY